jgi:hypothetical protein
VVSAPKRDGAKERVALSPVVALSSVLGAASSTNLAELGLVQMRTITKREAFGGSNVISCFRVHRE